MAAIGYGGFSAHTVAMKLAVQAEAPHVVTETSSPTVKPGDYSGVQVMGIGDLLTNIGRLLPPCTRR